MKTIIEPFRIKSVETLKQTTLEERKKYLTQAGLNTFLISSENVLIDLLTDSGTGAMSTEQWAAVMRGDESYAGSPSFYRFEKAVQDITGHNEVIPTHQGRACERILFTTLAKKGDFVVSNMLFDTTRANAQAAGCQVKDIPCPELASPMTPADFKGNIDLEKLESFLKENSEKTSFVVSTITNNSGGGQPVSMANLKATRELCTRYKVPLMIDACRFAENAIFIKRREKGYEDKTPTQIAREVFDLADVISISAKKDGMANMGGILAMKNPQWAQDCRNNLILTEGFPTYGGLSGRDLEAIAVGLYEALDEAYLNYRIRTAQYMGDQLMKADIPIVNPPGGHAIYIDAKGFLPHIPPQQFPGQSLVANLYQLAGIRAVEIGSVMFGSLDQSGAEVPHSQELVRLAFPRRTYTQAHFDYVIEALIELRKTSKSMKGVRFTYRPEVLRHFTARFEWVD
ncbi:tryptophanase [bacterium]|nr:tryptophanase [bacterium]